VSASGDGRAIVWQAASGHEVLRVFHDRGVADAAFSPDATVLATAGRDRSARLSHIASGRELVRFTHEGAVECVAFSVDGHLVVTGGSDGRAVLALWRPEDLIAEAKSRVYRRLDADERGRYIGDERLEQ
jgi:WD40 repeat protein